MSEKKVRRFDYDQEFQGFVDSASGALVLYIDYAARVGDLEHRLANCDADLFKMQQAKDRAERRLGEAMNALSVIADAPTNTPEEDMLVGIASKAIDLLEKPA